MKNTVKVLLCAVLALLFASCGSVGESRTDDVTIAAHSKVNLDALKEKYPEYFEMEDMKGIEVYVWQMAESSYRCGLLEGTNRNKADEEIFDLQFKSLSIEEAKAILEETGVEKDMICVIPAIQPYSSYCYEIDDEYTQRVTALFE